MAIAAVSSAARTAFRSSSVRSAATRLGSQAKAARCPFRLPSRNPLAHRIFRCPAEMGACMGSMQPYHNATASALMTSMLTVSRCGYGWLPEALGTGIISRVLVLVMLIRIIIDRARISYDESSRSHFNNLFQHVSTETG